MTTVWIAEWQVDYEPGYFVGVYATEELAQEALARDSCEGATPMVSSHEVITELPAEAGEW